MSTEFFRKKVRKDREAEKKQQKVASHSETVWSERKQQQQKKLIKIKGC